MAKEIKKIAYSPDGIEEFIFSGGGTDDNSNIVWVNSQYTGTEEDGTIGKPFKKIQDAIDNIPVTSPMFNTIYVKQGIYIEDVFIKGLLHSALKGYGGKFVLQGDLNIDSSTFITISNMISANDINISNGSVGTFINDVNIRNINSSGGETGNVDYFENIMLQTSIKIESVGITYINNCIANNDGNKIIVDNKDADVLLKNSTGLILEHNKGKVTVENTVFDWIGAPPPANYIKSTCDLNDGSLILVSGDAKGIEKTGTCDYNIGTFSFEKPNSTLTGSKIDSYGLNSDQIYDQSTRSNYTTIGATLNAHLDGINTALGNSSAPSSWVRKSIKSIDETKTYTGFIDVRINAGNIECRGNGTLQSQDGLFVATIDISDTIFQQKITPLASIYGINTIQVPIGFDIIKAYKNGPIGFDITKAYKNEPFLILDPSDAPTKLSIYGQVANESGMGTIDVNLNATIIL